ncbi:MAG: UbiA prenyltransferase family protein [Candidatus Thermoplasmatota archaeon]|nr:UbiA prenyltransferase family protein [Candidatus Thermoplasmatota archaeon]
MTVKLTMKEPYKKSRFLSKRLRGYIDLLRPFTLLAPIFVSMFIMFASLVYNDNFEDFPDWWIIIGQASLTLAILNGASNALNQATDLESDLISKPYRPIPRKVVERDEAQSIAYILYLFALLRAVTINNYFGVFVFLIMVFTVVYSLPPRMKRFLFVNQTWIAIPRGLFAILASWSVFGNPFDPVPLTFGVIALVFFMGAMTTKDIVDCEADRKTGTRTLINTFGLKKAAYISLPFLVIPFAAIPFCIHYHLIDAYFLPLTIFIIPSFLIFYLMLKQYKSQTLENTQAWSLMYVTYLFYAIGFTTLIIFGELGQLDFIPAI